MLYLVAIDDTKLNYSIIKIETQKLPDYQNQLQEKLIAFFPDYESAKKLLLDKMQSNMD